ncbi:MAG: hypothetical protein R3B72_50345 [Polyangiaceae bacterium]
MEWHVVVFGSLTFPKGGLTRWRKEAVDAEAFDDWKGELGAGPTGEGAPVSKMLKRIAGYPKLTREHGRVDVAAKGSEATFVGYLRDDAFLSLATEVATTFRVASEAGASGELYLLHVDGEEGYRIAVEPDASSCSKLRSKKKLDALEQNPLCQAASALYEQSLGPPAVVEPKPKQAADQGEPTTGGDGWPPLVAALEKRGPDELHRALLEVGGWFSFSLSKVEPVARAFPDGEALLATIRAGEPAAIKPLALALLAELDPAEAKKAALGLVATDAPDDLLIAAAEVLQQASDVTSTVALARALARPPLDQPTVFRGMLAAKLAGAPEEAIAAAVALLDELAPRQDADDALRVILELALRRQHPIPREVAQRLLSQTDPRVLGFAGAALLVEGSREALEALAAKIDQPGAVGKAAMRAVFRLDPKAAYDRLQPSLRGAEATTVRRQLLEHLADAVSTDKKAPELRDERFVDLALEALDEPGAVVFLGHTKDPRVAPALAAFLPKRFEEVFEALKRIGDASVLPALRAAAPKAPNPHCKKMAARIIQALEKKAGQAARA